MTGSPRLGGISAGLKSHLLLKARPRLKSDQGAQVFIQLVLEKSKDGACTTFLVNLFHCLTVLMSQME